MLNYVTEISENAVSVKDGWGGDSWSETNPEGNNWGLEAIKARGAWVYANQMSDIKIGVIDNGFNIFHEDFTCEDSPSIIAWCKDNSIEDDPKLTPGHGTHVLGTFAALTDNDRGTENGGVSGVFPNHIINGKSPNAIAYCIDNITKGKSTLNWKESLVELICRNVKVINISEGFGSCIPVALQSGDTKLLDELKQSLANPLGNMLHKLIKKGYDFVIINASGNDSRNAVDGEGIKYVKTDDKENYPHGWREKEEGDPFLDWYYAKIDARYNSICTLIDNHQDVFDRIIVVGAIKNNGIGLFGQHKGYSVRGSSNWGERVDILAPGENIYSTSTPENYQIMSGTSMAAPHVSGVAAMVWAINNNLKGNEIKRILKSTTSTNITDTFYYPIKAMGGGVVGTLLSKYYTNGLLNAKAAVEEALRMRTDTFYSPNFEEKTDGTIVTKIVDAKYENPLKNETGEVITGITVRAYPVVDGIVAETYSAVASSDYDSQVFLVTAPGEYELQVEYDGYESTSVRCNCIANEVVYAPWIKLTKLYDINDNILTFGNYPQSKVEDKTIVTALNSIVKDSDWKSYEYYSQEEQNSEPTKGNWMQYCDITYDGAKYRGVKFSKNRTTWENSDFSYQAKNGYDINTQYWFRWEPIRWVILNTSEGLVLSEMILDCQRFNDYCEVISGPNVAPIGYGDKDHSFIASNYGKSSIRDWLIHDFYDMAFSTTEKELITISDLQYHVDTLSPYRDFSARDKLFFLSGEEAEKYLPGEQSQPLTSDYAPCRRANGTDYAKCQGLEVSDYKETLGYSCWMLRSPGNTLGGIPKITEYGNFNNMAGSVDDLFAGVRPAMRVNFK